jgi:probable DNA metabolism protein
MYQLVYDGSFEGFLTACHHYLNGVDIEEVVNKRINPTYQPSIFSVEILTDLDKAEEVVSMMRKKSNKLLQKVYFAYLCDRAKIEMTVFKYIDMDGGWDDLRNDVVIDIEKNIHNLFSERHKMLGFLRFSEMKDGVMLGFISPKNNILPLLGVHFKKRFGNNRWVIVDKVRRLVIYYDGKRLSHGELEWLGDIEYSETEQKIRESWKKFFDSVAIKERISYERQRGKVPLWVRDEMIEFH